MACLINDKTAEIFTDYSWLSIENDIGSISSSDSVLPGAGNATLFKR